MQRLVTLCVLAVVAPAMAVVMLVVYLAVEIVHARPRRRAGPRRRRLTRQAHEADLQAHIARLLIHTS